MRAYNTDGLNVGIEMISRFEKRKMTIEEKRTCLHNMECGNRTAKIVELQIV